MINYTGLRKRPTFEGFVDYLANRQENVRYPDRFAKQIREHPYLTQLEGEGMLAVEEMDRKRAEEDYRERTARQLANQNNVSAQVARVVTKPAVPLREPGQQGKAPKGMASTTNTMKTQPYLQSPDDGGSEAQKAERSQAFRSYIAQQSYDMQVDDATKRVAEQQEDEQQKKKKKDDEMRQKLVQANLTGIRSNEGVVAQMMDTDTRGETRQSDTRGESPPTAKAKSSAPEPFVPSMSLPTSSSSGPAPQAPKMEPSARSKSKKDVAPKPMAQPKKTIDKDRPKHGVQLDNSTDREYWQARDRTKGYIINQLGLRGDRDPRALSKKKKK